MLQEIEAAPAVSTLVQEPVRTQNVVQPVETAPVLRTLDVDVICSAGDLAGMRAEWNKLHDASDAGAFLSWEWIYPWCRRIGGDRSLFVLRARDARGELVGLLPLAIEQVRAGPQRVRRLAFLAETHVGSDYLDVIAERGRERDIARLFAERLCELRAEWDVLDLVDLDENSVTVEVLREVFGAADEVVTVRERYVCPYETFSEGETFETFLRRTARRDNYQRRRKWLEKQPGYRIEKVDSPEKLPAALTAFFHLHSLRWSEDGGSQGIKGPGVESFHRDATHLLAERGRLRMYTMKLGDTAVASVYGIFHGDQFLYFQSGYDPAWRNKSVGLVLVGETFKDALERGCRSYDFLRGTESYKSDWTTKTRKTVSVRVHARDGAGAWFTRWEEAARWARGLAKRALPTNAVEKIRRLRRKRAAI